MRFFEKLLSIILVVYLVLSPNIQANENPKAGETNEPTDTTDPACSC